MCDACRPQPAPPRADPAVTSAPTHARELSDAQLEYDLGNLAAFDPTPVDAHTFEGGTDPACKSIATRVFQALVGRLFALPSEPAPVGRVAALPPPTTVLPREKPLPKPRPPTKWEVFAQRKGIVKHKRSKTVLDEGSQEFKRRYGYQKANDESAIPIIEAGRDDVLGEDPFTKAKEEKRARVKTQARQELANLKNAAKVGGAAALPPTLRLAAALPEHGKGRPVKRKELKGEVRGRGRGGRGRWIEGTTALAQTGTCRHSCCSACGVRSHGPVGC